MPWQWGVYRWLEGRHPSPGADDAVVAPALADAVLALRAMAPVGLPSAAAFNAAPFNAAADDAISRAKVEALGSPAALAAWDQAVRLGAKAGTASGWVHGDLMPGNLLIRGGELAAIIDWGASGVGDPALDLLAAWTTLGAPGRSVYLAALGATAEQIVLARALAVRKVAWGLTYYGESNPEFAATLHHTLRQVEADR